MKYLEEGIVITLARLFNILRKHKILFSLGFILSVYRFEVIFRRGGNQHGEISTRGKARAVKIIRC